MIGILSGPVALLESKSLISLATSRTGICTSHSMFPVTGGNTGSKWPWSKRAEFVAKSLLMVGIKDISVQDCLLFVKTGENQAAAQLL